VLKTLALLQPLGIAQFDMHVDVDMALHICDAAEVSRTFLRRPRRKCPRPKIGRLRLKAHTLQRQVGSLESQGGEPGVCLCLWDVLHVLRLDLHMINASGWAIYGHASKQPQLQAGSILLPCVSACCELLLANGVHVVIRVGMLSTCCPPPHLDAAARHHSQLKWAPGFATCLPGAMWPSSICRGGGCLATATAAAAPTVTSSAPTASSQGSIFRRLSLRRRDWSGGAQAVHALRQHAGLVKDGAKVELAEQRA